MGSDGQARLSLLGVKCRLGGAGFDVAKCETMEMISGMTKLIVAHKEA